MNNHEKPAAPAVGDNLLRDLARVAWRQFQRDLTGYDGDDGAALLASEPFKRLRAAWTAEAARERDDLALRLEGVEAHRERLLEDARPRDELQAKVNDLYTRLGMCVNERDEARATKDLHKERQQELEAEVERLRAAQQQMVNETETHADGNVGDGCWELAERFAGLVAAEAVDHTHDDEEQRAFVSEAVDVMGTAQTQRPADLAGALYRAGFRARNGQEAGQ